MGQCVVVAGTKSTRKEARLVLLYIELRHLDVLHFVIEGLRFLANGCTGECDCIGLMVFRCLSHVWVQYNAM